MKLKFTAWLALLLGVMPLKVAEAQHADTGTAAKGVRIHSLGQPLQSRYADAEWHYARNVWDMRLHRGRLYVGGGNSSNKGPAINAGPVPIMAYDFERSAWVSEGKVEDEQIDRFVMLDGTLTIPGHDPKQTWQWGNLYLRDDQGRWRKQRRIPDGVHTYDVVSHAGRWFAALGTAKGGAIAESSDRGANWRTTHLSPVRVYSLISTGDQLYAFPALRIRNQQTSDRLLRWQDGQWQSMPAGAHQNWLPNTSLDTRGAVKLMTVERAGAQVAYIAAYTRNDHQSTPIAAYVGGIDADGQWQSTRMAWPTGFVPWDVVVREGHIHWLLNRLSHRGAEVQVWRSPVEQPLHAIQMLSFSAPTFARALEVRGEDHFIGLGSDKNEVLTGLPATFPTETGAVWQVRRHQPANHPQHN